MNPLIPTSLLAASIMSGGAAIGPARAHMARMGAHTPFHQNAFSADALQRKADTLGVSTADLQAWIADGNTFAQILEKAGLTEEQFQQKMTEQRKAHLAELVASGKITQEQADKLLAQKPGNPGLHLGQRMHRGMQQGAGAGFRGLMNR